jgi:hypothetical protein
MWEGTGKPLVRLVRRWGGRGGLATAASFGRQWRAVGVKTGRDYPAGTGYGYLKYLGVV